MFYPTLTYSEARTLIGQGAQLVDVRTPQEYQQHALPGAVNIPLPVIQQALKQLDKETDARFVGYLGAVGEGSLALITIVAVSGVALAATPEIWHEIYEQYGTAGAGTFIQGGAQMITNGWGLPFNISQTLF